MAKHFIKTFRFGKDLIDDLKEIAEKENRSLNNLVETILIDYVDNPDNR